MSFWSTQSLLLIHTHVSKPFHILQHVLQQRFDRRDPVGGRPLERCQICDPTLASRLAPSVGHDPSVLVLLEHPGAVVGSLAAEHLERGRRVLVDAEVLVDGLQCLHRGQSTVVGIVVEFKVDGLQVVGARVSEALQGRRHASQQ